MTRAEGRKFAFTLAAGFAGLALLLVWRGRRSGAEVLAAIAIIAASAGLVAPTRLGPVERAWTGLGEALSRVTSPIFFAVLYWLVITPAGMLRRTFGRSPLARSRSAESFWFDRPRVSEEEARASLEHLF